MNNPLEGITVILTGSQKTKSVVEQIEFYGGKAFVYPLIKTVEVIHPNDELFLQSALRSDWLIFTSQNGVDAFCKKLDRHQMDASYFRGKVAAVGEKTAQLLDKNGFTVHFTPSIFSADVFVQEFPAVSGESPDCYFIRGERAKDTLRNHLPFPIKEWDVYTTVENQEHIVRLIDTIETSEHPIIIFASPSAVDCYYKYVVPTISWDQVTIASIGHITSKALEQSGANVTYQPEKYTMHSVIEEIVKGERKK